MIARVLGIGLLAIALTACGQTEVPEDLPEMGTFRLGHNIIVADGAVKSPVSRAATPDEWEKALFKAVDDRLDGYRHSGAGAFWCVCDQPSGDYSRHHDGQRSS